MFTTDRGTDGHRAVLTANRRRRCATPTPASSPPTPLSLDERWTLSVAGRFNRAQLDIARSQRRGRRARRVARISRASIPPSASTGNPVAAAGRSTQATTKACARRPHRAHVRRPRCAVQAAQRIPGRPAAGEGGREDVRDGRAWPDRRRGDWSAAVYRTELDNDIQFIARCTARRTPAFSRTSAARAGRGSSSSAAPRVGPVDLTPRYNHLDATFRSTFLAASPANSTADASGDDRRAARQSHARACHPIRSSCARSWSASERGRSARASSPRRRNTPTATRTTPTSTARSPVTPSMQSRRAPVEPHAAARSLRAGHEPVRPAVLRLRAARRECRSPVRTASFGPGERHRPRARAVSRDRARRAAFLVGVRYPFDRGCARRGEGHD